MKKLLAILLILFLFLTSCSDKGKDNEQKEQGDQLTTEITEQEGVDSDEEPAKDDSGEKAFTAAEGMIFDGRKGKVSLQQELERDGIRITFDYVLFDDEKGLFDPPPEGHIFMYPRSHS